MEDDSNTGKGDQQIGSSSNQEISVGQENAPAPIVTNVDASMMRMGESSSGTGRAQLSSWLPQWAVLPGYGKAKRRIASVYNTCSSDFNPSSPMRRRLSDGSPLDVERRPQTRLGRVLTLSQLPRLPNLMPLGWSPGAVPIQPQRATGISDPSFISPLFPCPFLPEYRGPISMPTIYEDSDQDADTSTPPTPSSNDEMMDADSDTFPGFQP